MTVRMLVDGRPGDTVSAQDRGLSYGDGLFETVSVIGGRAPLWSRHMARLAEGGRRLAIPLPDAEVLASEVLAVAAGMAAAVVRITVTRGVGPRGYAPPVASMPTRIVAAFPAPDLHLASEGVRLRVCDLRLAEQPALAGLKHLNRLEQVLARAEWADPSIHDGLLLDVAGRVTCTTMANVFAVIDGALVTPLLARCGVAGVARAEVLATIRTAQVRDLVLDELLRADELFLTSSVRGILPVQAVGDKVFAPGPVARAMQRHWRGLGFPLELA
ncbi:aminodeoxychorismate lyase [Dyella lutea]|uniref:Aminodeoxychorismate lyase n=1 Tax=Dyella lutea TaxID=2950441 RepID=A0ABT1FIE8_9GAMM|nr:aminodeoxychorismate lyase [Dyella lutea]MCP1375962.1 aminodeoxychorismate lyase [Dyella lutea]